MTATRYLRTEVYEAIDTERTYQDLRWNEGTTSSKGWHSLEEWYLYIQSYLTEGVEILARSPRQIADPKALETLRKIAAMCVCAMEQHGAPKRTLSDEKGEAS